MPTIWQEIDWLKKRVQDLEQRDFDKIIHDVIVMRNRAQLEEDLFRLENRLRKLIHKFGQIEIRIISD
ncbi:MAG: hypothetical protein AYK22_08455 [Thermoplasmatales archaeon SG8-52-3]|nr:MAG: hypothetical protein AYK22_08455 [Thermoplasmatales archaeon SG8-52-3]